MKINQSWKQCADTSKGGARSMIGKTSGFIAYVEALVQNEQVANASLIAKPVLEKISNQLKTVLEEIVKLPNFITSKTIESRFFSALMKWVAVYHNIAAYGDSFSSRVTVLVLILTLLSENLGQRPRHSSSG
jgi:hypothetical protein